MIYTTQWIQEWLEQLPAVETLVDQLTMAGLEVDAHGPVAPPFEGVIVAEVTDVQPHPDADRLRVCKVNDGETSHQVVCGAPNVRTGLKVVYATVGAQLPVNDPEPGKASSFRIKRARLRGVESSGMLCSAAEIGISDDADGLLELPGDAPVGTDVRSYLDLNDTWLELDLTPNRGDCLSIRGLAREISVLNNLAFTDPGCQPVPARIDDTFPVRIDAPDACPRYLGRVIRGVDVAAPTPLWMQERLRRCGLRSIDPVVDVTNYVLLELGQPMHAFDLGRLQGGIKVRYAKRDENLQLLDGKTIKPNDDTLLICDDSGPLALAGVMGGEGSSVTSSTCDVFLECAYFDQIAVAGRARSYGLHTDSSHRYERGVDPELQHQAIERATRLLIDICGGKPGPVVEQAGNLPAARRVALRPQEVSAVLGILLGDQQIIDMLQPLGLSLVSSEAGAMVFDVPSFRFDITIEADLIEELARIYGYDRLPVTVPKTRMSINPRSESEISLSQVKERLVALGYQEVITYSFVAQDLMTRIQPEPDAVRLQNPISADMAVMRTSLWPGLLSTLQYNVNRQQARARLFEVGQVFLREAADGPIEQPQKLAGLLYGSRRPRDWAQPREALDFYDLKGDVEALLSHTGRLPACRFEAVQHPALHPGQSARIVLEGKTVGLLGTLTPRLQRELDLSEPVFLYELDVAALLARRVPSFKPLSRYPEVSRDLAVIVDDHVAVGDIADSLRALAGEYLIRLQIFDVYQGDAVGQNKKSVALGLTWQHPSRTLGDDDVNGIINRCVKGLEETFNAKLRN